MQGSLQASKPFTIPACFCRDCLSGCEKAGNTAPGDVSTLPFFSPESWKGIIVIIPDTDPGLQGSPVTVAAKPAELPDRN